MEPKKIIKAPYIYKTSVTSDNKETIKRQSFAFGYLDGYFDEVTYEENIERCDLENKYYSKGYHEGVKERLKRDNEIELKVEKCQWVKKLAIYDSENNIKGRKLSTIYKEFYEKMYENNIIINELKKTK